MQRLALLLCCLVVLGFTASAEPTPEPPSPPIATAVDCRCFDRAELVALHERIVGSDSLAEAQEVALEPVLLARQALSRARWLAPRSEALRAAESRLVAYEDDVRSATSDAEVGRRFAELVRFDPDPVVTGPLFIDEPTACVFSTLEIVAIVLGFILGIIPGIILLLILC